MDEKMGSLGCATNFAEGHLHFQANSPARRKFRLRLELQPQLANIAAAK
jgi:hypothetical protein